MSREFDFSRLLAGYAGVTALPRRISPGVVIAAVDVFAVVAGLTALHIGGLMWAGTHNAPPPSLISPVAAAEMPGAMPDPHLRPLVAAIHLPATPDAADLFAAPVVTAAYYIGGSTFMAPAASSSPPQQVASAGPMPVASDPTVDPSPSPSVPPVAKLADIAIAGHVARHQAALALATDATLDSLLLSRGSIGTSSQDGSSGGASLALNAGIANTSATVAVNTGGGDTVPSLNVGANVEVASAAPVVSSVASAVGSTVANTVGGVASAVHGLLN